MADHITQRTVKSGESLVLDYFQRVRSGDLRGLLNLFLDDSIIYEPFSKSKCLAGKSEIQSFFETVIMANKGMQYEIKFEKGQNINPDKVVAIVTFHKGDSIRSRFTFKFHRADGLNATRIKTLRIEFID